MKIRLEFQQSAHEHPGSHAAACPRRATAYTSCSARAARCVPSVLVGCAPKSSVREIRICRYPPGSRSPPAETRKPPVCEGTVLTPAQLRGYVSNHPVTLYLFALPPTDHSPYRSASPHSMRQKFRFLPRRQAPRPAKMSFGISQSVQEGRGSHAAARPCRATAHTSCSARAARCVPSVLVGCAPKSSVREIRICRCPPGSRSPLAETRKPPVCEGTVLTPARPRGCASNHRATLRPRGPHPTAHRQGPAPQLVRCSLQPALLGSARQSDQRTSRSGPRQSSPRSVNAWLEAG